MRAEDPGDARESGRGRIARAAGDGGCISLRQSRDHGLCANEKRAGRHDHARIDRRDGETADGRGLTTSLLVNIQMNDTVIFLVLAGIALIFKWLANRGSGDAEKPNPPPSPNEPIRRAPPQSEEERVRRFLEALGVPPGSQAPPPVRPRTVMPRPVAGSPPKKIKPSWAQPLPPLVTTPADVLPPPLPPKSVLVVEAPPAPADVLPPPLSAELKPPRHRSEAVKPKPARALPVNSLGPILRSRESIRQAIILREVIGPPRGLEPFGQLAGEQLRHFVSG